MSTYVFLGPSLSRDRARAVLDATYLPPVVMGDLFALVQTRAKPGDVVGIIDGLFEQVPAVWHKEVLFAISRGVRVFGAASMGALRAAELHSFGMVGVGRIYEAYRSGELEDDADVAVAHGPSDAGFRPLSEAMVNVRWALEQANADGVISVATRHRLHALASEQFYAERTWTSVLAAGEKAALPAEELERLREFLRTTKPDAKGRDAHALLARLQQERTRAPERISPSFVLEETSFWIGLTQLRAAQLRPVAGHDLEASAATPVVLNHLRATDPEWPDRRQRGLFLRLLADLAGTVPVSSSDARATMQRLCGRLGLSSNAALDEWLDQQGMSKAEWKFYLELQTRCDLLMRTHGNDVDALALLDVKGRGEFAAARATVETMWTELHALGITKPTLQDAGIDADELQRWYERRCGRMSRPPEAHAAELGFETLRDFVTELIAQFMHEHAPLHATHDTFHHESV